MNNKHEKFDLAIGGDNMGELSSFYTMVDTYNQES